MNKEDIAERVFSWVETAAQNISDFAKAEVPPFINEFLTWRFYEAGISVAVWLIFVISVLVVALCCKKSWNQEGFDKNPVRCLGGIFYCGLIGFICLISLFSGRAEDSSILDNIKDMVQIKVAPKVYLVEEAAKIIKAAKE